jgi:hypothetical protein
MRFRRGTKHGKGCLGCTASWGYLQAAHSYSTWGAFSPPSRCTLLRRLAGAPLSPRDTFRWVLLLADAAVLSMAPKADPKAAGEMGEARGARTGDQQ